ncbi:MAG: CPCC family cysteine-rich protein [Ruminococcus callidus]
MKLQVREVLEKYQCPCCLFTYNVPPAEDWGFICPVCFWEMIRLLLMTTPADQIMNNLNKAKSNYLKFAPVKKRCYNMFVHLKSSEKGRSDIISNLHRAAGK